MHRTTKLKLVYLMLWLAGFSLQASAAPNWRSFVNGGEAVSPGETIAKSTVMLETDMEYCSATIIADNLLLTAAHCTSDTDTWVLIHFAGLEGSYSRKADRFIRHEHYRDMLGADSLNDVALVFFSGGLPEGFAPAAILPAEETLKVGDELQLAGYGNGGPLGSLAKVSLKLSGFFNNNSLLRFDQSKSHGICHGDSGGPAYKTLHGQLYLAGIAAYAYEVDCSGYSVYTRANYYLDWIRQQTQKYPSHSGQRRKD
jgi:secreted trypsin-like serine protease